MWLDDHSRNAPEVRPTMAATPRRAITLSAREQNGAVSEKRPTFADPTLVGSFSCALPPFSSVLTTRNHNLHFPGFGLRAQAVQIPATICFAAAKNRPAIS